MTKYEKIVLTIVLLSYFVTAIDSSIVLTALTKIAADLQLDQTSLSWIQNAYILAFGGFILLGGRLGDVFGRKRIINIALLLFGIGSALAGWATEAATMIFARFVQGVGAAIMAPTSLALLMDTFSGDKRVKAVAWYSSISGLGACIGLVLGGVLASYTSWRYGFYINVPLTLFMLYLSQTTLKQPKLLKQPFDIVGTLLSVTGIFGLVYAINGAAQPLLWFILSIVLLGSFVFVEARSKVAIMPLELFQSKTRCKAYLARTVYMCAMLGFWFYLSQYLQEVLHFSPIMAGIAFFPMTISLFAAAMLVPVLVADYGNKNVLLLGVSFLACGMLLVLRLTEGSTYLGGVAVPLVLLGFGQGLSMSPMTNLGIDNTHADIAGAASGMVNVTHQIGGSIGLAIMVALSKDLPGMMNSFHMAMTIGFAFIILMGLLALSFKSEQQPELEQ